MKRNLILKAALIALCLCLYQLAARAQTPSPTPAEELQKFEVGLHFSSLTYDASRTEPGLGLRLTYNVKRYFALEAEGNLFPHNARFRGRNGGRAAEGLFGAKLGKRYDRFGIFAKARPGLISFTEGRTEIIPTGGGGEFPFTFRTEREAHFALDLGGVLEFYPSRRIVTRFDAGDTMIRYGSRTENFLSLPAGSTVPILVPFNVPGQTTHNFQFSAGVGFRF
ncbi:MAG TPA: hypothetical protein VGB17_08940 [Pyrinomonadaceae bacterium]|jgi:hypothetical protein